MGWGEIGKQERMNKTCKNAFDKKQPHLHT